jgi:predicted esterase
MIRSAGYRNLFRRMPTGGRRTDILGSMGRFAIVASIFITLIALGGWHPNQQKPDDRQAEQRLADELTAALEAGRIDAAIDTGLQLVERWPANATHAYNLACAYSRNGDVENAVKWLQTAADRGFIFLATMQRDADLKSLREHAGYRKALEGVKVNSDRDLEAFKQRVADIEPLTILPPQHNAAKPAPLIVALHPTGGTAEHFASVWRRQAAKLGAILVAPQGMLKAGDGWRWGKVEHGDWLVLHAIEHAKSKYAIDDSRIIVTGFSEGGSVSFIAALRHPDVFRGAIPMCGEFVPEVSPVPEKLGEGQRLPRMYIVTGEQDRDVATNRQAERDLQAAGWPVKLREFAGMGHALPPNRDKEFAAAIEWVLAE